MTSTGIRMTVHSILLQLRINLGNKGTFSIGLHAIYKHHEYCCGLGMTRFSSCRSVEYYVRKKKKRVASPVSRNKLEKPGIF